MEKYKNLNNQEQTIADHGKLSGVHWNPMMLPGKPITCLDPKVQTMHDIFIEGHKTSRFERCLGRRPEENLPYEWLTYDDVYNQTQEFGSGLIAKGHEPKDFIGVWSESRAEWKIVDQACSGYSMVLVPLYANLSKKEVMHVIADCNLKTVVVDSNERAQMLLDAVPKKTFKINMIAVMDDPSSHVIKHAKKKSASLEVIGFKNLQDLGKENLKDFIPPSADDLHAICYTSGTTGEPKGAMLTHKNFVSNIVAVYILGNNDFLAVKPSDVYISYLPLANVYERVCQGIVFLRGASVGYFRGNVDRLLDDAKELKPTIFPMVPRTIKKVYDQFYQKATSSCFKSMFLSRALKSKMKLLHGGCVSRKTFWDKYVFGSFQNMLGGKVRICLAGRTCCTYKF